MKKLWHNYKLYVEKNYLCQYEGEPKDIKFWRSLIFTRFMLFALPIGILAYIPSMTMSVLTELWIVAFIDTLVILLIILLVLCTKLSIKVRKVILSVCFYLLSAVLLVFIGSIGPGLLYLLATSIFMTIIISSKAGYLSIIANLIVYALLALGLLVPETDIQFFNNYTFGSWIAVGANFLLINTVVVVSISALTNGLQMTILNEKKLQNELLDESKKLAEAKEKAIQSDKLKSAFLANMSHEIRTPLNSIVGFSNILLKQKEPEKQKHFLDIINQSSEQLISLINDIIDLSKIESGALQLNYQKVKTIDLVNSIVHPMSKLCPNHLKFSYIFNTNHQNGELIIDSQKVIQIVTNLITNAYKYTKAGTVSLIISFSDDNNNILFKVKDTGIGIEKEKQHLIFNRFYQETNITTGVGLGLAICNSLVNAMHGKIGLESESGRGSTFWVSLPTKLDVELHQAEATNKTKLSENASKSGLKILVAEDDENNFALINELLLEGEHVVSWAKNGNEALTFVKKNKYDIVIMDVKMPGIDGLAATRMIRESNNSVPIIALTAYSFDSDEERALKAGCNAYLSKPVDTEKLQNLLNKFSQISST